MSHVQDAARLETAVEKLAARQATSKQKLLTKHADQLKAMAERCCADDDREGVASVRAER